MRPHKKLNVVMSRGAATKEVPDDDDDDVVVGEPKRRRVSDVEDGKTRDSLTPSSLIRTGRAGTIEQVDLMNFMWYVEKCTLNRAGNSRPNAVGCIRCKPARVVTNTRLSRLAST
jgi:hypothetical protein